MPLGPDWSWTVILSLDTPLVLLKCQSCGPNDVGFQFIAESVFEDVLVLTSQWHISNPWRIVTFPYLLKDPISRRTCGRKPLRSSVETPDLIVLRS